MAINKNFVVKNGLEVSTNLIIADSDTRRVGIATSQPGYLLDVAGGIGATDVYVRNNLYAVGVGTFATKLSVGTNGTTLTGVGGSVGLGTALPAYVLDVRSPVSTGQTALYVKGDVRVTGDLVIEDDLSLDEITARQGTIINLNSTGITTVGFITATNAYVGVATVGFITATNLTSQQLNVSGISTLGVTSATNLTSQQLNVSGISTLGVTSTTNLTSQQLNVSGITTVGFITANSFIVSGISTLGVTSITNLTSQQLNVSGISTLGVTSATNLTSQQLNVSGISTLGITSATNLTSQQLNVSGISTLGVTSATNLKSQQLNVSGISTLGVTSATNLTSQQLNVSGISTLGVTSTTNLTAQQLNVSGISTFNSGPVLIGRTTSTGTASQELQVQNNAYFGGNVGIGTTLPYEKLHIVGDVIIDGVVTGTFSPTLVGNITSALFATNAGTSTSVIGGIASVTQLNVSGISTLQSTTLIGGGTSTGTALQALQVGGGAYFNGNIGIGTTLPTTRISIAGTTGISFGDRNIRLGDVSTGSSITTGVNNFFAGVGAGKNNATGSSNNFFGLNAGYENTYGSNNIIIGENAGYYNVGNGNNFLGSAAGQNNSGSYNNFFSESAGRISTGDYNNFLGYQAGYNNAGIANNFFGFNAGLSNNGAYNNILGFQAGQTNAGSQNNFLGYQAGYNNFGSNNNFFGYRAGYGNSANGNDNNFFGALAGYGNTSGSNNIAIGYSAGYYNQTGSQNIVIGYNQQAPILNGSNQLVIGAGNTAWITGNSSYNVGIGTTNPTSRLHLVGDTSSGPTLQFENLGTIISGGGVLGAIDFISNDTTPSSNGSRVRILSDVTDGSGSGRLQIQVKPENSTAFSTPLTITPSIVTISPTTYLNVSSSTYFTAPLNVTQLNQTVIASGNVVMSSVTSETDININLLVNQNIAYSAMLQFEVVGTYNPYATGAGPTVGHTTSRIFKRWTQGVHWNGVDNYVITGAALDFSAQTDGTNFPVGASANASKALTVATGGNLLLRLQNRTSPNTNSLTSFKYNATSLIV